MEQKKADTTLFRELEIILEDMFKKIAREKFPNALITDPKAWTMRPQDEIHSIISPIFKSSHFTAVEVGSSQYPEMLLDPMSASGAAVIVVQKSSAKTEEDTRVVVFMHPYKSYWLYNSFSDIPTRKIQNRDQKKPSESETSSIFPFWAK